MDDERRTELRINETNIGPEDAAIVLTKEGKLELLVPMVDNDNAQVTGHVLALTQVFLDLQGADFEALADRFVAGQEGLDDDDEGGDV